MIPAAVVNKRRRQGRWGSVLAAFAVLWGLFMLVRPVQAASLPTVRPANGVADAAEVVTAQTAKQLTQTNAALAKQPKQLQILIVTVPRDKSLVKTEKFVRAHYLTDGTYRAAVLYAPNNGRPAAQIVTSHTLSTTLTKTITDRILTEAAPKLRSRKSATLNAGFAQMITALQSVMNELYHYPQAADALSDKQIQNYVYGNRDNLFTPKGMLMVLAVMGVLFLFPGRRRDASGRLRPWWQGSHLVDERPEDEDDDEADKDADDNQHEK